MALINSLTSGVSAIKTYTKGLEVIGNNIANVNTTAFKKQRVEYADSFYNTLRNSGASDPSGGSNQTAAQVGNGVGVSGITSSYTQGPVEATGIPSDLSIEGNGFFVVRDSVSDRQFVTRMGNFRVDDQGYIVTQGGFRLQGMISDAPSYTATGDTLDNLAFAKSVPAATFGDMRIPQPDLTVGGNITNNTDTDPVAGGNQNIPDADVEAAAKESFLVDSFSFDESGNFYVLFANGDVETMGQLLLQDFNDPQALVREGNGLFTGMDAAGPKSGSMNMTVADNSAGVGGLGIVRSQALELSNVDLTEEFSNMITVQRSFQAGARVITTSDEFLQEIVNLKR
ncbi:MAG: flagellar hook-basal body complex protein [Opitutales bacterium]